MDFTKIKEKNLNKIENLGLTNDLFILNNEYFIKKSKLINTSFLNLNNQFNVINLIKDKSFTLKILKTKKEQETLIVYMPYFKNLKTFDEKNDGPEVIKIIGNLLKQLHKTTHTNNIITWNIKEQLILYSNLIATPKKLKSIKEDLLNWSSNYQPKKIVLCHNDLISNNIVNYENQWYLIDWDFACCNDWLFDIASFVSETLEIETNIKLWFEYFNLNNQEILIVKQWIKYQNFIWYHWAQFLYDHTHNNIYAEIAANKLNKIVVE